MEVILNVALNPVCLCRMARLRGKYEPIIGTLPPALQAFSLKSRPAASGVL